MASNSWQQRVNEAKEDLLRNLLDGAGDAYDQISEIADLGVPIYDSDIIDVMTDGNLWYVKLDDPSMAIDQSILGLSRAMIYQELERELYTYYHDELEDRIKDCVGGETIDTDDGDISECDLCGDFFCHAHGGDCDKCGAAVCDNCSTVDLTARICEHCESEEAEAEAEAEK